MYVEPLEPLELVPPHVEPPSYQQQLQRTHSTKGSGRGRVLPRATPGTVAVRGLLHRLPRFAIDGGACAGVCVYLGFISARAPYQQCTTLPRHTLITPWIYLVTRVRRVRPLGPRLPLCITHIALVCLVCPRYTHPPPPSPLHPPCTRRPGRTGSRRGRVPLPPRSCPPVPPLRA